MVEIRKISKADIGGFHAALDIVARESGFLRNAKAPPLEGVTDFVLGNIENCNPQFVAVADGTIVGWCDIVRATAMYESHSGELGMGVVPEWRGRGVGKALLRETVADADASDLLRIELSVHSDNSRALALYKGFGFVEEGRKTKARLKSTGPVDIIMMARLKPEVDWPA